MIASDLVLVIGAVSLALVNLGTLALQIITALKVGKVEQVQVVTDARVERVEKHTNGIVAQLVKAAEDRGAQQEKDKQ